MLGRKLQKQEQVKRVERVKPVEIKQGKAQNRRLWPYNRGGK